jgi:hypothetical protein
MFWQYTYVLHVYSTEMYLYITHKEKKFYNGPFFPLLPFLFLCTLFLILISSRHS